MTDATIQKEPFRKDLSKNVHVLYGWKDAHALVRAWIPPNSPIGIWYPVEIPADAIARFKSHFDDAYEFGMKPEAERALFKSPVQFEARSDCRGRWGYPDGHVELDVKRLLVWFTLEFPFEEFKLAKAAMDEAHMWQQLPAHVREMQGAA